MEPAQFVSIAMIALDFGLTIYFSESRRENALLKASEHGNVLRTIYKTDGEISQHFPKTLIDMSKLDGTFGCYS
jgi:hypothetical protein